MSVARRSVLKLDVHQLSAALSPLLTPILDQIALLNETVVALVNAINTDRRDTTVTHRLAERCEQLAAGQQIMSDRLVAMEGQLAVLLKNQKSDAGESVKPKTQSGGASVAVVVHNREEDYPAGSWLGNPLLASARVRCPIRQQDLLFINTKSTSPEKMALTLLDYLFPKETLATSNLSGRSKLGKKQLDPVLVYGIKCHLRHHFNTTDKQWDRIKHNIDSKCRTAWKKRRLTPACDTDEEPEEESGQVIVAGDHVLHNVQVLDGDLILPLMSSDVEDVDSELGAVSFVMEPMLEVLTQHIQHR